MPNNTTKKMISSNNVRLSILVTILFGVNLSIAQVTLPSMVTIPANAPLASGTTNFSMYVMTIYDEACVNQTQMSDVNSTDPATSADDSTLSQWTQSQYVVYIGAVALNNNNTCQVVCQVQTLKQFAIMFGSDIRTRSVLVGRVYMTTMEDDTDCTLSGSQGVCMAGECVPASDNGNSTTTTMMPDMTTTDTVTTTMMSNITTTEQSNQTTTAPPASG